MRFPPRLRTLLLIVVLGVSLAQSPAGMTDDIPVRVLLGERSGDVTIDLPDAHRVRTQRGAFDATTGFSWPLRAQDGQLVSAGLPVGAWIELAPVAGLVRYQGATYRGALRFEAIGDRILVVNVVDLEQYLRGVVPAEMQPSWPLEALKAQAIAARTYALYSLDDAQRYDICATTNCQVYRGVAGEHPRSDEAILATTGQVLMWNGAVVRAYYHSDSGGTTASAAEVWGQDEPYLQSRSDTGVTSPHRPWTVRMSPGVLARALAREGVAIGTPSDFEILATSRSGRASRVAFTGSAGSVTLSGNTLNRVLRGAGLKSTLIERVGPLEVRGNGWGHGVGMSQWGARSRALQGQGAAQILAHYYSGAIIEEPIRQAAR